MRNNSYRTAGQHRLPGHRYRAPGAYFFTFCTFRREAILAVISSGGSLLLQAGMHVDACWRELPGFFAVSLDAWVIMPDHVHGIVWLVSEAGDRRTAERPREGPAVRPLGAVIGALKSRSASLINRGRSTPGAQFWQRNYHERIIRSEEELSRIRNYIANNPTRWEKRKM
jgi:putative transposase